MNNIRINKYLYFILLCVLFIGAHIVCASETFKNNLLKMDFYQNSSGVIKVILYTSKPYYDSINVNKKSDFEYVILLPEIANSMTASPILNAVAGTVRAVSVKTQQYENNITGYTKITVATSKTVEITSQAQTLKGSDYQLSENDYKELLSQTIPKKKIQVKKEVKQPIALKKEVVNVVQKPKIAQAPAVNKSVASIKKIFKSKPHLSAENTVKPHIAKRTKVHLLPKVVENETSIQQNVVTPPTVEKNIAKPIEEPQIKTEAPIQPENQIQPKSETINPAQTFQAEKLLLPVQKTGWLVRYKNIIKNNLYTILGILAVVFILLLLGARKTIKNIQKQKETFISHLDEQPSTVTDFSDKISEDMTWREKFQTYREATQEQTQTIDEAVQPQEEKFEDIEELNELFGSEPKIEAEQDYSEEEKIIEEEVPEFEPSSIEEESTLDELGEMPNYDFETENISLDELFGEEETVLEKEEEKISFEQPIPEIFVPEYKEKEQDEIIKSEFAIDDEKGFYLVDFEDSTALVGHIEDEIFVLKRFKEKIRGPLQARLDERKANSASYMTKVGDFRALVEVTPNNMNLLIEL